MDPQRGEQVLRDQITASPATTCAAKAALKASDLSGRLIDRYTPAALASLQPPRNVDRDEAIWSPAPAHPLTTPRTCSASSTPPIS